MSFAELTNSSYSAKKEEFKIKAGEKELTFYANEISYLQRLNLSGIQSAGGDSYAQFIVYSITDQDGKHMTLDQAKALSHEHQEAFFVAAAKINSAEEDKKKAK